MNRTKSILVAASFSLALALTLSCSDDDSGGRGSVVGCKYEDRCYEEPASYCEDGYCYDADDSKKECEGYDEDGGRFYNDGCPSGSSLKCSDPENPAFAVYFYGSYFNGKTCEEFGD